MNYHLKDGSGARFYSMITRTDGKRIADITDTYLTLIAALRLACSN